MKPKKIVKNIVIQGLIFNIILLIAFGFILLSYTYPEYKEIENKKNDLVNKNKYYEKIKKEGIDYKKFNNLNSSLGKDDIKKSIYLQNILKEFDENTFNNEFKISPKGLFLKKCKIINDTKTCNEKLKEYLKNTSTYDIFLKNKVVDIDEKKLKFEKNGINKKISKIVPYYTEDSNVDNDSLTDFKFINYIENLLDKFNLTSNDQIGIGNLSLEESFNGNIDKKKVDNNVLDSKIYYFPLKLKLSGAKRDIINFIYYIENVGKINFINGDIFVFTEEDGDLNSSSFDDIKNYFYPEKDFYNNLFFDIKNLSFSDYIDLSEEPASKEYLINNNVWGFIKDTQGSDELKIDLDLRFYVKGQPLYKMKKFILNVEKKYLDLLKISNIGIKYIKANKSELKDFSEVKAMRNFKKYNLYLTGLKKNISDLKKNSKNSGDVSKKYKESKSYDKVFDSINKDFVKDLKSLSSELFENNKMLLGIIDIKK